MTRFCAGAGINDSRIISGMAYNTISFDQIVQMAQSPPSLSKEEAYWFIPSTYYAHDARVHEVQREKGDFHFLLADIDEGNPSFETIDEAITKLFGRKTRLIYNTVSSTPNDRRWRILIPLASGVKNFTSYQLSLNDALQGLGLVTCHSLERPAQIVYLPNRGEYYLARMSGDEFLNPLLHPISKRAAQYDTLVVAAHNKTKESGPRSFVSAFKRKHSLTSLLTAYGYARRGNTDHWRSPYQQSNSYATMNIMDEAWFSLSQSDADAGLGEANGKGRFGDQFDLYVHFSCGGNKELAVQYARQCLQEEDDKRYGAATTAHGKYVWDSILYHQQQQALAAVESFTLGLGQEVGNNDEWRLGWPPGLVGELAQWIYASSSRPVKQYSIAAALYYFTIAGRKFNVDGKGLNLYMMLVGGTGRGKGIVKQAVDKVVDAIVTKSQDPTLAGPFNYEVAVSEAGLRKGLSQQNPMCAYEEELGLTIAPMTSSKASANDIGLRKILTRLFDSGEGTRLGIKQASSIENTKDLVHMPCLTLAGDTQPVVFRSLLGNGMLDTGFAPRMVPFFYYGKRAYHNVASDQYQIPPTALVSRLTLIAEYCLRSSDTVVPVKWGAGIKEKYQELDVLYTDKINAEEPGAEMFNRAGIIVSRIAALFAIGCNHLNPVITDDCYLYAKEVVWRGLLESQRILSTGGAGQGESVRMYHLREAVKSFVLVPPEMKVKSYRLPAHLANDKTVINEFYLIKRLGSNPDFQAAGNGTAAQNVRETIDEAIRQEMLADFLGPRSPRLGQRLLTVTKNF